MTEAQSKQIASVICRAIDYFKATTPLAEQRIETEIALAILALDPPEPPILRKRPEES